MESLKDHLANARRRFDAAAALRRAEDEQDDTWWGILRSSFFHFDRRTLGMARIFLGFFLVMDLFRRTADWFDMFSNEGVLPAHVNLFRPQAANALSIVNAFATKPELVALWIFAFLTFMALLVGFKTKVAQVISLFLVAGMNGRVLLIENGGYVVHNLLLLWTMFLPLGGRFSVDSMLASMRRTKERTEAELNDRANIDPVPHGAHDTDGGRRTAKIGLLLFGVAAVAFLGAAVITSSMPLAMAAIAAGVLFLVSAFQIGPKSRHPHRYTSVLGLLVLLQLAAIYYFNVVHKTGPAWKNGQAVHFVLYVDRMVTPGVAHIREHIPFWLIIAMTKVTLAFEAAVPIFLLSPLWTAWARRCAIAMINALHIGFGTTFVLGPFAWAACVFSTTLFSSQDWEVAISTMRRERRGRVVVYDRSSPGALWACRVLKRLDGLELLAFRAADDVPTGIAVERADGSRVTRAVAFGDLVEAMPLGPCVAWLARAPGASHLVAALMQRAEGGRFSRFFGLVATESVPHRRREEPAPSPLRVTRGKVAFVLGQVIALVFFSGAINQAMAELWVVNRRIKVPQPEPMRVLAHKMRFLQGWFMFSPNPVMDDGTIVVDALTVDGRRIDPFTGKEPDFDLLSAKSLGYNQIWCDYFNRIHLPANTSFREHMKEYMHRLPERTGNPNDALVSGDIYWVQDMNPRWGDHKSWKLEKLKLFSFEGKTLIKADKSDARKDEASAKPDAPSRPEPPKLIPGPAAKRMEGLIPRKE